MFGRVGRVTSSGGGTDHDADPEIKKLLLPLRDRILMITRDVDDELL